MIRLLRPLASAFFLATFVSAGRQPQAVLPAADDLSGQVVIRRDNDALMAAFDNFAQARVGLSRSPHSFDE